MSKISNARKTASKIKNVSNKASNLGNITPGSSIKALNRLNQKTHNVRLEMKKSNQKNIQLNNKFANETKKISKKYAAYHKKMDNQNGRVVLPALNVLDEAEFKGLSVKDQTRYVKELQKIRLTDFSKSSANNEIMKNVPKNLAKIMKDYEKQGRNISEGMAKVRALTLTVKEYTDKMNPEDAKMIKATKGLGNKLKEISARESRLGEFSELTKKYSKKSKVKLGAEQVGDRGEKELINKAAKMLFENKVINESNYKLINNTLKIAGSPKKKLLKKIIETLEDSVEAVFPASRVPIETAKTITNSLMKAKRIVDGVVSITEYNPDNLGSDIKNVVSKIKSDGSNLDDYLYSGANSWRDLIDSINYNVYKNATRNNKVWQRFVDTLESKIRGKRDRDSFAQYMAPYIPDLIPSAYEYGSDNNNLRIADSLNDILTKLMNRYHAWLNIKNQPSLKEVPSNQQQQQQQQKQKQQKQQPKEQ